MTIGNQKYFVQQRQFMGKRPDTDLVQDILTAIDDCEDFISNLTMEEFEANKVTSYASIKAIEIIGEAAARLSDEFKQKHDQIPWKKIIGIRNILVHVYHNTDLKAVYNVIKLHLPNLKKQLKDI